MVQQSDGSYIAKCPDGRWWPAPACRSDLTKCIPTFTASPGWKLQAMMQWTAAYGFPAAISISNVWGNFEKHVRSFRALHYWWVPDSTFVEMLPQPVVFPRHIASEWAEGNKKTGGAGSYVSKMVSYNLQSKARLVQEFVGKISLELPDVQDMLLTHKQSGASDYFDVACDFIKKKRSQANHWTSWIPDKTQCTAQFGLYNEQTQQFVQNRDDPANLICLACPSGHYSAELKDGSGKTFVCRGCPVGTSQPSGASLACDPCPKGEYQDEEATSSCKRCEVGKYQSELGQTDCRSCPRKTTTLGFGSKSLSDCGCEEGRINIGPEIRQNGSDFECVGCDDGLYCPFSSTLQNLRDGESQLGKDYVPKVLTSYYTPVEDPLSVTPNMSHAAELKYRCEPAHVCPKGPPGLCLGGLQGNPCAICPDGQFFTDNRCKECGAVNVLWPIGIVAGLSGFFLFYYIGNAKASAQASPIKVGTMAAGIALNVMQTIALMGMMTVEWPAEMENTSSGLQFMVLDVQMAGGQCFMGSDATGRYTITCLLFPVIVLWMLCCSLMTRRFVQCAPFSRFESYAWTWPRTFNIIGLLLQVGFSTASAVVMQPLMCYRHPNGMRSLLKYPNVMCGESEQGALLAVGMVTGSLFIVAFYSGCVVAALKIPSWSFQRKNDLVMCIRFLTSNFRLNRWWFGLLVMARGFGFGLIIVIATDTPAAQTSLATLILVVYGFLQAVMWPWKAQLINVADVLLSSLMLLLVGRTKMKEVVVASNHNGWNFSRIFTLMLLIAIAITIILMVAASLCAILLHLFGSTQGEEKKRQTGRFLNLNNLPFLDKVAMALQDIGEAMQGSDVDKLIENLAEINHYDLKVILDAMQIITTEVMHVTSVGHRQSVQSLNSFVVSRRVISENGLSKMRSNLSDTCESRPKDRGSQRSIASSRTSQNTLGTHMSVADSDMPKKNDEQTDEKSNAPAESASSPAEGSSAVVEAEYNVAELESVGISLPAQGRVVAENL